MSGIQLGRRLGQDVGLRAQHKRVGIVCGLLSLAVAVIGCAPIGASVGPTWTVKHLALPTSYHGGGIPGPLVSDVWCVAPEMCMAVGGFDNPSLTLDGPFANEWNGRSWALKSMPSPAGAKVSATFAVSCTTASACTAVGYSAGKANPASLAERWNGLKWSIEPTPNPPKQTNDALSDVACPASHLCLAAGYVRGSNGHWPLFAEKWNGSKWSLMTLPSPAGAVQSNVEAMSCATTTACVVIGNYGTTTTSARKGNFISAWSGGAWTTKVIQLASKSAFIRDVSCTSATTCTAVGSDLTGSSPAVVLRWTGGAWSLQNFANSSAYVLGVSCTASNLCTAVGASSAHKMWAELWNGKSWMSSQPAALPGTMAGNLALSCWSGLQCMAVGSVDNKSAISSFAERS